VAYVCVLAELRAEVAAAQTSAAIQRGLGADVEAPAWHEVRGEFDEWLFSEPAPVDRRRQILTSVLL